MLLPDDIILKKIVNQNVFYDRASLEKSTKKIKKKYKLAGNILKPLEVYTFFVITKNESACNRSTTIEVEQQHWENKKQYHLNESKSYIDLQKVETLSGVELCQKTRDKINGFLIAARLCDDKYNELKSLKDNVRKCNSYTSTEKIVLVKLAIQDIIDFSQISDQILQKLGLD